jgi:hypothetical protein
MSERLRAAMLLARTPEQQEIAREIYRRFEQGAEVEDVRHLVERHMRLVIDQRRERTDPGARPDEDRHDRPSHPGV